jgi:RNA polymerase sigma-70 factor, ECF subfamily
MNRAQARSKGVNEAIAVPVPVTPERAELSFEQLYRSSRDDVYAYVATLLRDRSAAEDVTAQAFERAYRKQRSFRRERGSARAWLFGIARNAALDELRRQRRLAPLLADPAEDAREPQLEAADQALRRLAVRAALDRLSGRERDLIALKYKGGLTNAEIARVLRTSESNAGTMLHRTIEKLREGLS